MTARGLLPAGFPAPAAEGSAGRFRVSPAAWSQSRSRSRSQPERTGAAIACRCPACDKLLTAGAAAGNGCPGFGGGSGQVKVPPARGISGLTDGGHRGPGPPAGNGHAENAGFYLGFPWAFSNRDLLYLLRAARRLGSRVSGLTGPGGRLLPPGWRLAASHRGWRRDRPEGDT